MNEPKVDGIHKQVGWIKLEHAKAWHRWTGFKTYSATLKAFCGVELRGPVTELEILAGSPVCRKCNKVAAK